MGQDSFGFYSHYDSESRRLHENFVFKAAFRAQLSTVALKCPKKYVHIRPNYGEKGVWQDNRNITAEDN